MNIISGIQYQIKADLWRDGCEFFYLDRGWVGYDMVENSDKKKDPPSLVGLVAGVSYHRQQRDGKVSTYLSSIWKNAGCMCLRSIFSGDTSTVIIS